MFGSRWTCSGHRWARDGPNGREGVLTPRPTSPAARTVLLAIAATWFLIQAMQRAEADTTVALISLVQALAFGLALLAVALIDWRERRWWWLVVALLVVSVAWVATGHPLLFLVGA